MKLKKLGGIYFNNTTYRFSCYVKFLDKALKNHRTDGPSVMWKSGDKSWFKHGKLIKWNW